MTDTEVIELIEDAWREVPYPGDDQIFTPNSYDDEDIGDYFRGTTWRGHSPLALRCHSSAFTFFTPQAFHYWLPAFLIAAIQNPEEADVVVDYIPWSLSDQYAAERWPLFSRTQKQAVAAYLRLQIGKYGDSDTADARMALSILEKPA